MILLGTRVLRLGRSSGLAAAARAPRRTAVSRAGRKVTGEGPPTPQERAASRIPGFMRRYVGRVANAPVSHVTAFLIVHELSAIVPLFGIWGAFYYMDYTPLGMPDWVAQKGSAFIRRMAERNHWDYLASAERGSALLLQGAAAYGIVKMLMPVRVAFSLWAMPWFARWFVVPVTARVGAVVRGLRKRS